MDNNLKNKNFNIEFLRAFAIIAVVIIHTFNSALIIFGDTTDINSYKLFETVKNLMWWAVPCFFMITGSLLLNRQKEITLSKLYRKYIFRMILVLFLFGSAFAFMELFFETRTFTIDMIFKSVLNVLSGNTWAHMWYIYCLIGIYVILPLLKKYTSNATDKEMIYIVSVLFLFESVLKLTSLFKFKSGFYCHINTIYPFWVLMGEVFNRKIIKLKNRENIILLVVSSLLLSVITYFKNTDSSVTDVLFGYDSVVVAFQSIAIYGLFSKIKFGKIAQKVLIEISDKSFGIYLVHMIFVNAFYKMLNINVFSYRFSLLMGLALVFVNILLSYIIVWVLKRIPFLKKII